MYVMFAFFILLRIALKGCNYTYIWIICTRTACDEQLLILWMYMTAIFMPGILIRSHVKFHNIFMRHGLFVVRLSNWLTSRRSTAIILFLRPNVINIHDMSQLD